ncbi:MAG: PfkB family carbohydrate kinase [Planctomycetota bacterium]
MRDVLDKVVELERLAGVAAGGSGRVVLAHGCFDVLHPGHVRYLREAAAMKGDGGVLVVTLTGDAWIEKGDGARPWVPERLRAECVAALGFVDWVAVVDGPTAEGALVVIRPGVYVKGKEYAGSDDPRFLAEAALVRGWGGRVAFASGEVVYSSTGLLGGEGDRDENAKVASLTGGVAGEPARLGLGEAARLGMKCDRWGVDREAMERTLAGFAGRRVMVVGDLIVDRYVFGEGIEGGAGGIRVSGQEQADVGGAGVVALHLAAMGAEVVLGTALSVDDWSVWARGELERAGVSVLAQERVVSTAVKERFVDEAGRVRWKVDRAGRSEGPTERIERALVEASAGWDAVVFADFGLGVVTPSLIEKTAGSLRSAGVLRVGDVSGRGLAGLGAMAGFDLVVPTAEELGALTDGGDGLIDRANRCAAAMDWRRMVVTQGPAGCLLMERVEGVERMRCDELPSLVRDGDAVVDEVGAGDALLAGATLALCGGAGLAECGYVGSLAASLAVGRLGNRAVSMDALRAAMSGRHELQAGVDRRGVVVNPEVSRWLGRGVRSDAIPA